MCFIDYDDDLSLAEIASGEGISRQGIRHIIKKSEELILFYEEKLGLAKRFLMVEKYTDELAILAEAHELPKDIAEAIQRLTYAVRQDS